MKAVLVRVSKRNIHDAIRKEQIRLKEKKRSSSLKSIKPNNVVAFMVEQYYPRKIDFDDAVLRTKAILHSLIFDLQPEYERNKAILHSLIFDLQPEYERNKKAEEA